MITSSHHRRVFSSRHQRHHTSCFRKERQDKSASRLNMMSDNTDVMTQRIFLMRWTWTSHRNFSGAPRDARLSWTIATHHLRCNPAPQDFLQRKKISSQSAFVFPIKYKLYRNHITHRGTTSDRELAKRFYYSSVIIKYPSAPPRRPSLPFACHSRWSVTLW